MTCANGWSSTVSKVSQFNSLITFADNNTILVDLAASFPVQEMPRAEETSNFIGMTYFNLCAEVDAETTKGKKLYQTVSDAFLWNVLTTDPLLRSIGWKFSCSMTTTSFCRFSAYFRPCCTSEYRGVRLNNNCWPNFNQIRARNYRGAPCLRE